MIIFSTVLPNLDLFKDYDGVYIYNLYSHHMAFENLNILYSWDNSVFRQFDEFTELDFDIDYHSNLINNPSYFVEMFGKVIIPHHTNSVVIILVDIISGVILESFIKFIQLRYDTLCGICDNEEDIIDYINNCDNSINNIENYDYDLFRYHNLIETNDLIQAFL